MLQRFTWNGDRAGWPRLRPGWRYPPRCGRGHIDILARKVELDLETFERDESGRCYYQARDHTGKQYEQNDFALLNKIDHTAGAPERSLFAIGQQLRLDIDPRGPARC